MSLMIEETNTKIRPSWIDYYLGLALKISERSHDSQTKHGCILVKKDTHSIVSTGYNGFPRSIYDEGLPTTRPAKYPWMIHAEVNSIYNAARLGHSLDNCVAFITGQPCNNCLMALWQCGISTAYIIKNRVANMLNEETQKIYDEFIRRSNFKIVEVEFDYSEEQK